VPQSPSRLEPANIKETKLRAIDLHTTAQIVAVILELIGLQLA